MSDFFGYRPSLSYSIDHLPLALKAIGCHCAERGWEERNTGECRPHCGCFWIAEGCAELRIQDQTYLVHEGDCLCYHPFESHFIHVTSGTFQYYWFIFDGSLATQILDSLCFPRIPHQSGEPPAELFCDLARSLSDYSLDARYHESAGVYRLLTLGLCQQTDGKSGGESATSQLLQRFKELVECSYMSNETNLNSLARQLGYHRTTITRLLKKTLGVLPNEYINNVRLQHALQLLEGTTLTAEEISRRCGFATPNYFSRKIKLLTGYPPNKLRNLH